MITTGPFNQCIKTGLYFSLGNDDRVFTGDLFYNFATREFQIRGIPSFNGVMSHVLPKSEPGPVTIQMYIPQVLEAEVRDEHGRYMDLRFTAAKISQQFMVWIEEWYSQRSVIETILQTWQIEKNLVWLRP